MGSHTTVLIQLPRSTSVWLHENQSCLLNGIAVAVLAKKAILADTVLGNQDKFPGLLYFRYLLVSTSAHFTGISHCPQNVQRVCSPWLGSQARNSG